MVANPLVNKLFANSSVQRSNQALSPGAMLTGLGYYDFEKGLAYQVLKVGI